MARLPVRPPATPARGRSGRRKTKSREPAEAQRRAVSFSAGTKPPAAAGGVGDSSSGGPQGHRAERPSSRNGSPAPGTPRLRWTPSAQGLNQLLVAHTAGNNNAAPVDMGATGWTDGGKARAPGGTTREDAPPRSETWACEACCGVPSRAEVYCVACGLCLCARCDAMAHDARLAAEGSDTHRGDGILDDATGASAEGDAQQLRQSRQQHQNARWRIGELLEGGSPRALAQREARGALVAKLCDQSPRGAPTTTAAGYRAGDQLVATAVAGGISSGELCELASELESVLRARATESANHGGADGVVVCGDDASAAAGTADSSAFEPTDVTTTEPLADPLLTKRWALYLEGDSAGAAEEASALRALRERPPSSSAATPRRRDGLKRTFSTWSVSTVATQEAKDSAPADAQASYPEGAAAIEEGDDAVTGIEGVDGSMRAKRGSSARGTGKKNAPDAPQRRVNGGPPRAKRRRKGGHDGGDHVDNAAGRSRVASPRAAAVGGGGEARREAGDRLQVELVATRPSRPAQRVRSPRARARRGA